MKTKSYPLNNVPLFIKTFNTVYGNHMVYHTSVFAVNLLNQNCNGKRVGVNNKGMHLRRL